MFFRKFAAEMFFAEFKPAGAKAQFHSIFRHNWKLCPDTNRLSFAVPAAWIFLRCFRQGHRWLLNPIERNYAASFASSVVLFFSYPQLAQWARRYRQLRWLKSLQTPGLKPRNAIYFV